jgi:hypothetical protein
MGCGASRGSDLVVDEIGVVKKLPKPVRRMHASACIPAGKRTEHTPCTNFGCSPLCLCVLFFSLLSASFLSLVQVKHDDVQAVGGRSRYLPGDEAATAATTANAEDNDDEEAPGDELPKKKHNKKRKDEDEDDEDDAAEIKPVDEGADPNILLCAQRRACAPFRSDLPFFCVFLL